MSKLFIQAFSRAPLAGLALFAFLMMKAPPAHAGFEIGNGGDAMECAAFNGFPAGTYTLDFLLSSAAVSQGEVAPVTDLKASMARLHRLLDQKLPSLSADFAEFSENFLNRTNWSRRQVWEPVAGELVDVVDEGNLQSLPAACRSEGRTSLRQAVIRSRQKVSGAVPGQRVYAYDPKVLDAVVATSPVQLSFLLVHEWLWDYSHVVARNRRVAAYLHGNAFENDSPEQAHATLIALGFPVPDGTGADPLGSTCDDVPVVTQAVHSRYSSDFGRAKLGSVRFDVAERQVCPDSLSRCDRTWRSQRNLLPEVLANGLQAHVWYGAQDALKPVKIINPDAIRSGDYPSPSKRAILSCATPEVKAGKAECTLDDALAGRFLAGRVERPKTVVLEGVVGESCMSVSTTYAVRYGSFTDEANRSHDVWLETVLTVSGRLIWPD